MKDKKQINGVLFFAIIIITAGSSFPIYNFTKSFGKIFATTNLFMNISLYLALGAMERPLLKNWRLWQVAFLNLGLILIGMLFRFLLEFGEVSNTYNFTAPNIALHIFATFTISMISYLMSRKSS